MQLARQNLPAASRLIGRALRSTLVDLDQRPIRPGRRQGYGLGDFVPVNPSDHGPVSRAEWLPSIPTREQLSLDVSVQGLPNAGKSSLVNALVRATVSASSGKRHTTKRRSVGVVTVGRCQVALADEPGIIDLEVRRDEEQVAHNVEQARMRAAREIDREFLAQDLSEESDREEEEEEVGGDSVSDLVLLTVDIARRVDSNTLNAISKVVAQCGGGGQMPMLVLNKADLLLPGTGRLDVESAMEVTSSKSSNDDGRLSSRSLRGRGAHGGGRSSSETSRVAMFESRLEDLTDAFEQAMLEHGLVDTRGLDGLPLKHVHVVSSKTGAGIPLLRRTLFRMSLPRAWSYASHVVTDQSAPQLAEEIIREKVFRSMQDEVPYRVQVSVRSWAETEGGSLIVVHADLTVPSGNYAAMLTGRGGSPMRAISRGAERSLEQALNRRVRVLLHVSVKKPITR
jgi:GTPase Era involved in 16S rRNA processing